MRLTVMIDDGQLREPEIPFRRIIKISSNLHHHKPKGD
jgi:hypothetical protein